MPTIKRQLSLIILSLSLVAMTAGSAFAQESAKAEKPCDTYPCADGGSTEPVGTAHKFNTVASTNPVVLDERVSQDVSTMGALATKGEATNERSLAVQKFFGEAFGQKAFSGEATSDDIWALNAGLMIGMLPYAAKYQPQAYKSSVSWLTQHTEFASKLDKKVAAQLGKLVAKLEAGEKIGFNDAQALYNAAYAHLSTNTDSRIHGYLAGGIWAALAYIDRTENIGTYSLALSGDTLAFLFRQNAKEGGTDVKLADQLAKISAELQKEEGGDNGVIIGSIAKMRAVE